MNKHIKNSPFAGLIALSIVIIALSVGYYLVIFLPQREQSKIDLQNRENESSGLNASLKNKQLEQCLGGTDDSNTLSWISYCESTGQISRIDTTSISQERYSISPNGQYKKDLQTGISYTLDENWVFSVKVNDWIPNFDRIKNCKLSNDLVDRIDKKTKEQKDECFKKYPQK